jgi:hypothetical protein
MNAPIFPLHKRPNERVVAWIHRLDQYEPHLPAALAIYTEAAKSGLVEDLREGLRLAAAANRREAHLLAAEKGDAR